MIAPHRNVNANASASLRVCICVPAFMYMCAGVQIPADEQLYIRKRHNMQYTALLISFNARIFSVHNKTRLRALTTLSIQDQGAWQGGGWRRGFWAVNGSGQLP